MIKSNNPHLAGGEKTNPIPPFAQASFLNFATLPRDRTWHISKLATLPRAPYQPHAKNNYNYTTLHNTTQHYTTLITLHYNCNYHYIALHDATQQLQLHYFTLHYTTLYHTTLYHATVHYNTLHYHTAATTATTLH